MARAIPTKEVIQEIKSILEYSNIFNKVEIGKNVALEQENTFPSCYIKVDGTVNKINGNLSVDTGCEYDRLAYLRLVVYLDLSKQSALDFLDYQDKVEKAFLSDNLLWKIIVDRNFMGSEWDNDVHYPRKEGTLALEIMWRSSV